MEVQCSKFSLQQEAGAFGNDMGKELQKPRPKLKNMYIIYLQRIFALPAIQGKLVVFCKHVLIL